MTSPSALLAFASREIGYCRHDDPLTGTKYGRWYGLDMKMGSEFAANGVAFCDMFASYCLFHVHISEPSPGRFAYTPYSLEAYRKANRVRSSVRQAQPGDRIYFSWDDDSFPEHVGIVERNYGTYVQTIEGNTGNGEVLRRTRSWDTVVAVAAPLYDGAPSLTGVTEYNPNGYSETYVREVQQLLIAAGYSVGPDGADGVLGANTFNAVKRFQAARGLHQDGIPGENTLAALRGGKPITRPKPNKPGKLDIDEYFGRKTADALAYINGTTRDGGVISSQDAWWRSQYGDRFTAVEWVASDDAEGSQLIMAMQRYFKRVGLYDGDIDGLIGPKFIAALIACYGGGTLAKAIGNLQRAINKQLGY